MSKSIDIALNNIMRKEALRQQKTINLIASENYASKQVKSLLSSDFTNKYAEGYSRNRYYGGCEYADELEDLCMERACKLFESQYANVQPHSGSQANQVVMSALLKPGDTIMGLDLKHGGHLSHGSKVNFSGIMYKSVPYELIDEDLHYDYIKSLAINHNPKLIIAGYSSYSQPINWMQFKDIAEETGSYLLADISHTSGFVATKLHENPINFADVVTCTTHKTLRGPRGGLILSNDEKLMKKINNALFPGIQGGPHMNVIAAKTCAFYEALQPEFADYMKSVQGNARVMCEEFKNSGFKIVSDGTHCHMFTVDLTLCGISGKEAQVLLENHDIIVNKNMIPNDSRRPSETSGIRIGTAAITTQGYDANKCKVLAKRIVKILKNST